MTREEAIKLIEQALNIATKSGAFNMEDIGMILKAMSTIKEQDVEYIQQSKEN